MGLSERFKEKLEVRDIFKKVSIENPTKVLNEMVTSNPINNSLSMAQMEDLETKVISKIRKTPYWKEYPTSKKERMIAAYFDSKNPIADISAKNEFIKNIIALAM